MSIKHNKIIIDQIQEALEIYDVRTFIEYLSDLSKAFELTGNERVSRELMSGHTRLIRQKDEITRLLQYLK